MMAEMILGNNPPKVSGKMMDTESRWKRRSNIEEVLFLFTVDATRLDVLLDSNRVFSLDS
jgi:hypothetical protein